MSDLYEQMTTEQLKSELDGLTTQYNKFDSLQNNAKLRANSLKCMGL